MGGKSINLRPRQERISRTKWTPALDKIFADLVVEQIQLGNRPNNVFDKKTWNHIRHVFNKQTALNFNGHQLRKHLDVLRIRFHGLKSAPCLNDDELFIDDSCNIDFELWDDDYEAQPQDESSKAKECPIFEQLSKIFAESRSNGKYAQSSHFEEIDKSPINELDKSRPNADDSCTLSAMLATTRAMSAQKASKNIPERKRKRSPENVSVPEQVKGDKDMSETMAKALFEMLNASTLRKGLKPSQKEKFTITKCIQVLDEIEAEKGMTSSIYFIALDLFEDPNMREVFVSLKSNKIRLAWLRGKCGNKLLV